MIHTGHELARIEINVEFLADKFDNEAQAVEELATQLVGCCDQIVHQHREHFTLFGVGRDQVVKLDITVLANTVDASHPLLEADQTPGAIEVGQHVGALEIDAFVAGVGAHEDLKLAPHESLADLVALAMGVGPRVSLSAEALGAELLDQPRGGVGELREDDSLLAGAGADAVGGEAVVDEGLPLRGHDSAIGGQPDAFEQFGDLALLLTGGSRRLDEDTPFLELGLVVELAAVGDLRGESSAHTVTTPLEGAGERVQRGCCALAVDHAPERHCVRGKVAVDQVERLTVELGLDRSERDLDVESFAPLEQRSDAIPVDEFLLDTP